MIVRFLSCLVRLICPLDFLPCQRGWTGKNSSLLRTVAAGGATGGSGGVGWEIVIFEF